jgi:hypothetical protein
LSIRQPWAYLVVTAQKTIELRSWATNYRGPLIIHAARRIDEAAVAYFGLDAVRWPVGVALGIVQLVDVLTLSRHDLAEQHWAHRSWGPFRHGMRGFLFAAQELLSRPVPMPGAQGLFRLPRDQWAAVLGNLAREPGSGADALDNPSG